MPGTTKHRSRRDLQRNLQRVNRDLEAFIHCTLDADLTGGPCGALPDRPDHLRCWEFMHCPKRDCPVRQSEDPRCWLQVGTACGAKPTGRFTDKYQTCLKCDYFRSVTRDPLRRLYENINIIILHLHDRASRLRELAIKDPLTGLYNRNFFNEVIGRELGRVRSNRERIAVIAIDVDRLKWINDTHGHATGDRALESASRLIRESFRSTDLVFRIGGDEFLVLLANTTLPQARRSIRRLEHLTQRFNQKARKSQGGPISFSLGLASCRRPKDWEAALKTADQRMYLHKMKKKKREL